MITTHTGRFLFAVLSVLLFVAPASPQHNSAPPPPSRFEIGRRTFFDFGPPFDYFEIFIVRPLARGSSVERILLTPPGNVCLQQAKVEVATAVMDQPVESLWGSTNPCAIPEKDLRRELKRCKHCLVFSGAQIVLQVQCGSNTRLIRADILDKDVFDPLPNTPQHTSWTMQLLGRLDQAVGPGVMDKPMLPTLAGVEASGTVPEAANLRELGGGEYDGLFPTTTDKPSGLYRSAQVKPPAPSVRLVSSAPFAPAVFVQPDYPPIARAAHIEGAVSFTLEVGADGHASNLAFQSGNQFLRPAVERAAGGWRFPSSASGQRLQATIEFALNCPQPQK